MTDEDITIHIDLTGLNGYLALGPTFEMIDELGLKARWLPISALLNRVSTRVPEAAAVDPLAEYKARRQKARDRFARQELSRNCQRLGISESQGANTFEATWVHIGLLYLDQVGGDSRTYVEKVYESGFDLDQPLDEVEAVSDLLRSLGVDPHGFNDYLARGRAVLDELELRLLEEGVFDSPAYIYQNHRFHGRQHLPLIRWYLTGCVGLPPV